MNYEEYCERVGENAVSPVDYDFNVEPFYMALEMDKDEFCKFIQTDGAKQAMKAYIHLQTKFKDLGKKFRTVRDQYETIQCWLTREQDKAEYEEAKRVYDLLGHTMVDAELREILQKKMEYFQNRLSK